MLSDIEIANAAELHPILRVAQEELGIEAEHLVPYGHDKAKVDLGYVHSLEDRPLGKLILMTALSPTPAGEGKTTTTVGLTDALHGLGLKAMACLREPSMGPVFGMKGGAAGGGYAQVVPMTDINLHFTGDFTAIAAANNLLAALIDNHVHHGNALDIDVRSVDWKRVVDLNDRALRDVTVGLGGLSNGYPRQDGFDIVVASELMAIFCLTESWADLKRRIGDIVVGYTRSKKPVTARELGAHGAMAVLLRDALAPNLVQTLEHAPAFVHGGPFANIAHGCSSVVATRTALRLADYVVTEAGFGADLGAEKFVDIKCRKSGLRPAAAVVVATVRALKFHGGVDVPDLGTEDLGAIERGMENLARHLRNVREVYGIPCVVALNRFPADTDEEVRRVVELVDELGVRAYPGHPLRRRRRRGHRPREGRARPARGGRRVDVRVHLPRRPAAEGEGRDARAPAVRRVQRHVGRPGEAPARPARGRRLRRAARLRGQDAVLVLHRRHPARRTERPRPARARGAALRRGGLRGPGLRRRDDDAGPARDPRRRPDRPPRRRHHRRPVLTPERSQHQTPSRTTPSTVTARHVSALV